MNKQEKIDLLEQINSDWCDNEEFMGEQAALSVACEMNGTTVDWFYDNEELLTIEKELENETI